MSACRSVVICTQNILNTSWVHISLKSKKSTFREYCIAKFFCFFGIAWHGDFVHSKQFSFSVTETKREAILFWSLVNSEGYSEIGEPIRSRKDHYSPARYMPAYIHIRIHAHMHMLICISYTYTYIYLHTFIIWLWSRDPVCTQNDPRWLAAWPQHLTGIYLWDGFNYILMTVNW